MVANCRDLRRGNQSRKPGQEFHRRHDAVGSPPTRDLQAVRHSSIRKHLDAIEREGWARAIAQKELAALVVAGCDAHGTVDVEAVARRREAPLPALHVGVGIALGRHLSREERAARERELHAPLQRRLRSLFNANEQEGGKNGKIILNSSRPSRLPVTFSAQITDGVGWRLHHPTRNRCYVSHRYAMHSPA